MGDVVPLPPRPPRWLGHEAHLRFVVRPVEAGFSLSADWDSCPGYGLHAFNRDIAQQGLGPHATKTGAVLEARRMCDLHGGTVVDATEGHPGVQL